MLRFGIRPDKHAEQLSRRRVREMETSSTEFEAACIHCIRLVVELKRDMIVRGTLESVDAGMGLTLTDVVFENVEVGEFLLLWPHPCHNPNVKYGGRSQS